MALWKRKDHNIWAGNICKHCGYAKKKGDIICLTEKYQLGLEPFLPSQTIDPHIHHSVPEYLATTLGLAAYAYIYVA